MAIRTAAVFSASVVMVIQRWRPWWCEIARPRQMATDAVVLVVVGDGDGEVRSVRVVGVRSADEAGLSDADVAVEGEPHVGPLRDR